LGELLSNLKIRGRGLHPEDISIVTKDNSSLDTIGNGTFDSIVAFFCPACVPVKMELEAKTLSKLLSFLQGHAIAVLFPNFKNSVAFFSSEVL
jgi:hypothetical protein